MANIFPRWTNWLAIKVVIAVVCIKTTVVLGITYYCTPKYTRVGYMPNQPIPYDHSLHVGQLGLDCRYCHFGVEQVAHSNVPTTQTCMNCHSQVKMNSPKLAALRESWETGTPVEWVKIHKSPDYVYFNHAVHVNRGVSCYSCHGKVNEMRVVWHEHSQSMGWCLDCHRAPEKNLRPLNEIYNLDWQADSQESQIEQGLKYVEAWNVNPPVSCAGCHR
ncbi:MAG: cytochrome c3 family protein [Verrucomicrobiota bacterium]